MSKINNNDPLSKSTDIVSENIQQLQQLFPEVFKEGKIDWQELQATLGEHIDSENERFNFTWNGKSKARREAQKPSTGTLRPAPEESVDWENTQNLYIEGDNLEVLKLLQKSYHQKVKMIYIDPPYNTGKDFVYKDNYKDNLSNYLKLTGQKDEEGKKLSTNSDAIGRFHSNWLNMMYPRLKLARNLLTNDGAIFVSIGVEEFSNLKSLMNEIFGEENFVEIFSWVKTSTPPALSTKSRKTNEYILCFEKNKNGIKYNGEELSGGDQPLLNSGNKRRDLFFPKDKVYFKEDKFPNGKYLKGQKDRVELKTEIEIKDGYSTQDFTLNGEFKWTQEFLNEEFNRGTTFIIKSELLSIRFIRDEEGYKRPTNFIKEKYTNPLINKPNNKVGTNENATSYLSGLMKGDYFDYPKPINLIEYLTNFICKDGDIVIDFFAGSGTTGESVFNYNLKNTTKLKFILVQLQEVLDVNYANDSKERKKIENTIKFLESINKPSNISELGKERIRLAGKRIKEVNPEKAKDLDLGFKVFKLDSSNIKAWSPDSENLEQNLLDAVENIKEGRSENDLLFEILLKYGLDLTLPITEHNIAGAKVFNVGAGALFVCLADDINEAVAEGIAELKKELNPEICRVVFKDNGFEDSAEKTNVMQKLKQHSIEEVRSI
jgi:adenine-specific DNA-methyltransferase